MVGVPVASGCGAGLGPTLGPPMSVMARRHPMVRPGVVAALAVAAGLGLSRLDLRPGPPTGPAGEVGVAHVHELGINPADGRLLAATHQGLFRIPFEDPAAPIGDRYQDTMALTVVGPDHLLASGHPDLRERDMIPRDKPPLLGLIESIDAGRSWRPLSLLGAADFHVLAVSKDRIFGLDSTGGQLMVTGDGRRWEPRAPLVARDLAVSPEDADFVLAPRDDGLAVSRDGGRTFAPAPGPPLVLVSWPAASALWGVTGTGEVHLSLDGGDRWEVRGVLPGAPEAFLAGPTDLYAAVAGRGILQSRDGGRTWERLNPSGPVAARA